MLKVINMFKVKNEDKKRCQMMPSSVFIINFAPFSSISIVDFEQVIVCWDIIFTFACPNFVIKSNYLSIYTL